MFLSLIDVKQNVMHCSNEMLRCGCVCVVYTFCIFSIYKDIYIYIYTYIFICIYIHVKRLYVYIYIYNRIYYMCCQSLRAAEFQFEA